MAAGLLTLRDARGLHSGRNLLIDALAAGPQCGDGVLAENLLIRSSPLLAASQKAAKSGEEEFREPPDGRAQPRPHCIWAQPAFGIFAWSVAELCYVSASKK